jgi:nucleotide-binding universal stress UspA family protein
MEAAMSSPVFASPEFGGSACAELVDPRRRLPIRFDRDLAPPILVALDGDSTSPAALHVAAALAARDGVEVETIVVEGTPPSAPGMRIAEAARASRASLILMGLSREGLARRLLGSGAVARVVQSAQKPLLAVRPTERALPHAAVAAIDFSAASLRGAREARDLLDRPGTLHLVHVRPTGDRRRGDIDGWDAIYDIGATIKLRELACELSTDGVTVLPRIESGALIETLLRVASEAGAEVIACGARNHNATDRHLLGYVPLQLVLNAERSVLIAPAAAVDAADELP